MKKLTSLFILMIFGSSMLFAQMTTREQIESQGRVSITDVDPSAKLNPQAINFTDDLFDYQFDFICGDASGEAGIETNGNNIYTSLWNSTGFCCYEMDGTFLGTFQVPGESAVRDLAYDGTYFYGAAASTALYEMDFVGQSGTLISTLTAAVATRACAYDAEFDAFWGNNWSDPITLYDRTGGILNQFNCGAYTSYYGFARLLDGGDQWLYGFAQAGGASQSVIVQIDPVTGAETGVTFDAIGYSTTGTGIAGGLAAFDTYAPGWWTLLGIIQNEAIFGVEGGVAGEPPVLDLKLTGIQEPNTGFGLGVEDIVIGVKNSGSETQSNFDVQYRVDGGAWVVETIPGPLAMNESIVYTFNQPYDFSAFGEYYIEAEVILAGDENPGNNSGDKTIENKDPSAFCEYSITLWDDYGDGWNGGYVQIFGDGVEFINATLATGAGPETFYFDVADGAFLTAVWTAGGWPYECSYIVYNFYGDPIFEDGMGGVDPIGGDIGYAACGPVIDPEITVDPLAFNVNLDPGTTGQEFLNIGNIGEGTLNWDISVAYPPMETATPTNVNAKAEPNASITDKDPVANSDWDYDCPAGSVVSQPCPDYSTAMTADEAGYYDFYQSFSGGGEINGIRFWGIDAIFSGAWTPCTGTEPKTFHIGFFADDAGQPGTMIDEFTLEVPRVNTGDLFASTYTMWEYEVALPSSVTLVDGWFSVMALIDNAPCWFLALNAPSGAGVGQQWDGTAWNPQDPMGFCLLGEAVTPWLTVAPLSGTVDPQGSEVVTLDFNAQDLASGTVLYADLFLTSNDPVTPEIIIPVELVVGEVPDPPVITWDPTSFTQNVAVGGSAQDILTLGNIGVEDLEYTISTEYVSDAIAPKLDYSVLNKTVDNAFADFDMNSVSEKPLFTDAIWDIQIFFDQVPAAVSQAGVETDNEFIYSAVWNAGDFVKFDFDGNVIEVFQVAGATNIRDMAYDGEYFYGGAASSPIYQMDFATHTLIGTIAFSGDAGRAIAYDDEFDGFWTNNWSSDIILIDRTGGMLNSIGGSPSIYGLAYDMFTAGGPYLWLFEGTTSGGGCWVSQWSIATGAPTGVTHDVAADVGPDGIAGGLALGENMIPGTYTLLCLAQGTAIIGYELGGESVDWLSVDPNAGTIVTGDYDDINVYFDAAGLEEGNYYANIFVNSNDPVNPVVTIPVEMIVGSSVVTQVFNLETGYQFISSSVIPPVPDMMVVMGDVLNDNLAFVRSSTGTMLRKIGPNWVNGIGDWIIDEGYLVKMNADDSFAIEGLRIDPATGIPVALGYQFVSYFPEAPMDALVAFGTIIGDDLDFIRDSQGAMLRKIGPNWVNGIGDALPGEGYLVKMFADGEIIYPAVAKSSGKTHVIPSHLIFEGGNAAEAVYTMYIAGLEIGDEVAAYNGNVILGSMTVISDNVYENDLPIFSQVINGQGYVAGEPISLKVWSNDNVVIAKFEMESVFNSYVSNVYPSNDGEFSVVNMTKGAMLTGELVIYPNPATNMINISSPNQINSVVIYNYVGQSVYEGNSTQINTSNFDAGVYIIRIETTNGIETQKVTIK
jgi:hypothetical protein